ncbi:Rab effector Noc2 [Bulinus truncatus]|nr:Rab effector Noc2 [Bulinus truncatus]
MGEFATNGGVDRWVCPNDRQLSLRAKLGTGWSVHTNKIGNFSRPEHLTLEEQEQILRVITRAEYLEGIEQERIGRRLFTSPPSVRIYSGRLLFNSPPPESYYILACVYTDGRLVEKLDNMKKNAIGNGSSQCILCGDEFKILSASPTYCDDCIKLMVYALLSVCLFVSGRVFKMRGGYCQQQQAASVAM